MADDRAAPAASWAQGFLGRLTAECRARMLARMRVRNYAAGTEILAVGDSSRETYVLLEGRAIVSLYSADGKIVSYRELNDGDIFGEMSALDGLPRSAFVTACGEVKAGSLSADDLEALLRESPDLSRQMMVHLSEQVRRLTERIFEYSAFLVRERLMRELARRARQVNSVDDRVLIHSVPTHFELAAQIGTHREAVTKALGYLARRDLVVRQDGGLLVKSMSAMESEMQQRLG